MKASPFRFRRVLPVLAVLFLPGCLPPQADFEFGLGTTEIVGTVELAEEGAGKPEAIIVTLKNHYKFSPVPGDGSPLPARENYAAGSVTHPTAHVQNLEPSGRFAISIPSDVVSVDVMFIAADHLTDTFRFTRSLGIGRVTYRATLQPMPDWRGHFYTFLEPQLQDLIVDQRYRLPDREQKWLGDWLLAQKKRLEAAPRGGGERPLSGRPGTAR